MLGEDYEPHRECREERLTGMIQMLAHFHIAMASRRDMKVPLHLIPLQAPINPTTRPRHAPPQPRRFLKPSLLPPVS